MVFWYSLRLLRIRFQSTPRGGTFLTRTPGQNASFISANWKVELEWKRCEVLLDTLRKHVYLIRVGCRLHDQGAAFPLSGCRGDDFWTSSQLGSFGTDQLTEIKSYCICSDPYAIFSRWPTGRPIGKAVNLLAYRSTYWRTGRFSIWINPLANQEIWCMGQPTGNSQC